jgi:hypothetical protein
MGIDIVRKKHLSDMHQKAKVLHHHQTNQLAQLESAIQQETSHI